MDRGFDLESLINQGDTLLDSHYSSLSHEEHQINWFTDQRSYSRQILGSWGLSVGQLPYSNDNETTLKCLLELISQRQRDIEFRNKAKEDVNALQFEKQKYRSYMEQGQRVIQQHLKRIGRLENENNQLKSKSRRGEAQSKRQKEDDRRMIAMLRSKNQQILHEIKKKEQQLSRMREQMKKSIGQKGVSYKNSFQIIGNLQFSPQKSSQQDVKFTYLLQRNERELSDALKENALLREKIYAIREELVHFGEWIDQQVFGQKAKVSQHRFFVNHSLMMREGMLTDELNELLEVTKDGILQMRKMFRNKSGEIIESLRIAPETFDNITFKKKKNECKTERAIKVIQDTPKKEKQKGGTSKRLQPENVEFSSPRSSKPLGKEKKSETCKQVGTIEAKLRKSVMPSPIRQTQDENPFGDTLISSVETSKDCSIVSHISVQQLGKSRFDKWDMLYDDDQE